MDKYRVKLMPKALRDLESIYSHIVDEFREVSIADHMAALLENTIFGLEVMPYRGAVRKTGGYSNSCYRQLFVKNYTVVYRILEEARMVLIVTVRYTPSNF